MVPEKRGKSVVLIEVNKCYMEIGHRSFLVSKYPERHNLWYFKEKTKVTNVFPMVLEFGTAFVY